MRAAALGLLLALAATLAGAAVTGRESAPRRQAASRLPPPVKAAFTPGPATRLAAAGRAHYAPVLRATAVRVAPGGEQIGTIGTRTPEGTDNVVAVLAHREDAQGRAWVRIALAVLPNGTTGWVPRGALGGYGTVTTRLDVDLEALTATLYRAGRAVLRAPIGAGAAGSPTPRGRFYIRDRLSRYRSAEYGPIAFGTSARSPTATDWPAGGYVGIHGTDRPDLLPGRVSHGCIRLRNADILRLARAMPVGTPVTIH